MIFYADDDYEDQEIFQEIAEDLGVEMAVFNNGIDLLERLKNPPPEPSLIFLDINMPGYNGLQILEMIRADAHWKKVPIIMFTTSVGEENIRKSLFLGATYYLPKYPDFDNLKKSIQYVIGYEWKDFLPKEKTFVYQQQQSMFDLPVDFQHKKTT